jgi:pimeloyl-ACP methyl ester carboxylesterase
VHLVLIAGLWLDGSAWDAVVPELQRRGHRGAPLWLPGQGAPPPGATLEDQRRAVVAAVDAAVGPVLVVGHSAAATLAWMAADARPDRVAGVVMIGGFPASDGTPYAPMFAVQDGQVPFPGWAPFDGPDAADLDGRRRREIAARAIPVPAAVAQGIVRLQDERRFGVPVTLVCPEYSPDQARGWVEAGEVAELGRARHVAYVDIDSGHWPMFTRPRELAEILAAIAAAA